jgi:hypothetical protein
MLALELCQGASSGPPAVSPEAAITTVLGVAPSALWLPGKYPTDVSGANVASRLSGPTLAGVGTPAWSATGWDATRGAMVYNGTSQYATANALAALITGDVPWSILLALNVTAADAVRVVVSAGSAGNNYLAISSGAVYAQRGGTVVNPANSVGNGRCVLMHRYAASKLETRILLAAGETVLIPESAAAGSVTADQFWLFAYITGTLLNFGANLRVGCVVAGSAVSQANLSAGAAHIRDSLDCPLA